MKQVIKWFKIFSFALLLTALNIYSGSVDAAAEDNRIYYYNIFDNINDESETGMMMYDGGTSLSLTEDPASPGNESKCMLLSRITTTGAKGQAGYTFGNNGTDKPSDSFVIQFDFYLENLAPTYLGDLYGFTGGELKRVAYIRTTSSGGIMVYDNSTSAGVAVPNASYKEKEWYSVVMSVDLLNNKTTYYLNGELLGDYNNGADINYLTRLDFGFHEQAPTSRKLYIDNVYVFDYGDFNANLNVKCETDSENRVVLQSSGDVIYYTTDGSLPNGSSPVYNEPIEINDKSIFIRAVAFSGSEHGAVLCSGPYSIQTVNGLFVVSKSLNLSEDGVKANAVIRNYDAENPRKINIIIMEMKEKRLCSPPAIKAFDLEPGDNAIEFSAGSGSESAKSEFFMMIWAETGGKPGYPICKPTALNDAEV